nr:gustatory receptor 12 [Graphosoma rubrolineatum]
MASELVIQEIFYIPTILGTFPFGSQFSLSKKLLAYCSLVRFLSVFGAISAFIYNTEEEEGSFIGVALRSVAVMSALGDNFFTLLWWVLKRHKVSFLMESIVDIQRRKKIILEGPHIRYVHLLLILTLVTHVFSYYNNNTKENSLVNIINEFSYFLSSSSTICFVGQFWDILHLLGHLFRENTQLFDESSVINYERFLMLCEMINDIYGPPILLTITEYFVRIIIYFYELLLPMYPGFSSSNILIIVQAINCIMPIVSMILACNFYIKQVIIFLNYLITVSNVSVVSMIKILIPMV